MEKKDIETLINHYRGNIDLVSGYANTASMAIYDRDGSNLTAIRDIAAIATLIDVIRGDMGNVSKGLETLAAALVTTNHEKEASCHPVGEGKGLSVDETLEIEALKTLGAFGVEDLRELRGYSIGRDDGIILHINKRGVDSGWTVGDSRLDALKRVMLKGNFPFEKLD